MEKEINLKLCFSDIHSQIYCFNCDTFVDSSPSKSWSQHVNLNVRCKKIINERGFDKNLLIYGKYYATLTNKRPLCDFPIPEDYSKFIKDNIDKKKEVVEKNVINIPQNSFDNTLSIFKNGILDYLDNMNEINAEHVKTNTENILNLSENNNKNAENITILKNVMMEINKKFDANKKTFENIQNMLKNKEDKNYLESIEHQNRIILKAIQTMDSNVKTLHELQKTNQAAILNSFIGLSTKIEKLSDALIQKINLINSVMEESSAEDYSNIVSILEDNNKQMLENIHYAIKNNIASLQPRFYSNQQNQQNQQTQQNQQNQQTQQNHTQQTNKYEVPKNLHITEMSNCSVQSRRKVDPTGYFFID